MRNCRFCRIIGDPSDSDVVWEDDSVLAIMDTAPVTDGHVLIIPKPHSVGLSDIEPITAARVMNVAQIIAGAQKRADLHCDGVNLFFADGEEAFQEIFHSHLHVIPRFSGDGFSIDADWKQRSRESLTASASSIREALTSPRAGSPSREPQ